MLLENVKNALENQTLFCVPCLFFLIYLFEKKNTNPTVSINSSLSRNESHTPFRPKAIGRIKTSGAITMPVFSIDINVDGPGDSTDVKKIARNVFNPFGYRPIK